MPFIYSDVRNERSVNIMKRIYDKIMYGVMFLACYCSYCKLVMITVDIYTFSNKILLIIIAIGIILSVFIMILIHRLFQHFEVLMNRE